MGGLRGGGGGRGRPAQGVAATGFCGWAKASRVSGGRGHRVTQGAPMTAQQGRSSTNHSDRDQHDPPASEKPEKYRFADNLPDDGEKAAEREYEDTVSAPAYWSATPAEGGETPGVLPRPHVVRA